MLNKLLLVIWFIKKPKYYLYFFSLIRRKFFLINHDNPKNKKKALVWAKKNTISYHKALNKLDIKGKTSDLNKSLIIKGQKKIRNLSLKMGGSGHIHLLFNCVKILKAKNVIETGVAYGWSSLAILKGLSENGFGKLFSVDMPYPRKNNEIHVGIVVPKYLKRNWILIRKPDNPGVNIAINKVGKKIDLCHYDSDKSWWGRHYSYPILWKCLKVGGLFISDDIQDNLYFSEFVRKKKLKFAVIKFEGKFVGLIRKNK